MKEMNVTPIKTLHKRIQKEGGASYHECWSLVEVDGARQVLYEVYDQKQTHADDLSRRVMTVQEALREPRPVSYMIWLALED